MKDDLVALLRRARSQLGASTYILATLIVILAGMLASFLSAATQNQRFKEESNEFLTRQTDRISVEINQRMQSYEQALNAGASLFQITGEVTHDEWRRFVMNLELQENLPGTLGLGYGAHLYEGEQTAHVIQVRRQGFADYSIRPRSNLSQYVPVTYIEPLNEQNRRAFGYDMFSEPVRRQAITTARDTGSISITGSVRLVQEGNNEQAQPGILAYVPVYEAGTLPNSTSDRRLNIKGYTYAALRMGDMFDSLLASHAEDERYDMEVKELGADGDNVLYRSANFSRIDGNDNENLKTSRTLAVMDKSWQLTTILDTDAFRGGSLEPPLIFILGSALSVLIGSFLFVLMLNRLGRIAVEHEIELQQTKDELLALASHQLRTPASGVKQYVGMILQGYAGRITKEQRQMLKRAYSANDRQLEIINQLLYVAKADAGQLRLDKEKHDFTATVKEVIRDYSSWAEELNVKFKPRRLKHIQINADKRYVRMAVENLLSNAIKYSYEGCEIDVKIETVGRRVRLIVKDTGVGIAKTDLPKLFQKFTRIDNPLTRQTDGSGIGLYLSQQLVKAHGGTIKAIPNNSSSGTTFIMELPGVVPKRRRSKKNKKAN